MGEFRVSNTRDGDEALELVRDGALDSFSIGFGKGKERKTGDLVERLDAELREVSLVSFPAYAGAVVAGIRSTDFVLTEQARFQMLLERGIL
ncbi:MAG: HK97 family phage prohead protease [Burkholderiales bacterium]